MKNNVNDLLYSPKEDAFSDGVFIFKALMEKIREEYGAAIYSNWFTHVNFKAIANKVLVIAAPSKFVREWIISNYFTKINKILEPFGNEVQRLDIVVDNASRLAVVAEEKNDSGIIKKESSKKPFITDFDGRFAFENFIVDHSNKIAFVASQSVACVSNNAHGALMDFNIMFVHSKVGMGKTHLLRAIGYSIQSQMHNKKAVGYLSAERFMHHYIMAVRNNNLVTFKERFRELDILLIDDLQFICDKSSTQKEFANTINALLEAGKKVIIACDRSPYDLNLDVRTKSRISSGVVAEIGQADFMMRQKILKQKKSAMGIDISDEILDYLASNISSNIRELEGAMNKLVTHCSLNELQMSIDLCCSILKDCLKAHEKEISMETIIQVVADLNGATRADVISKSRLSKLVYLRQMIAYIAKCITKNSLYIIGKHLGDKDHATVIYYIRQFEQKIERHASIKNEVDNIIRLVKEHLQ